MIDIDCEKDPLTITSSSDHIYKTLIKCFPNCPFNLEIKNCFDCNNIDTSKYNLRNIANKLSYSLLTIILPSYLCYYMF